jgi:CubicO group peptidase (beta-lactamase class C family)
MTNVLATWGGIAVRGSLEDGYGPVLDAFARNFRERQDLGSGCTVYVDGRCVVDLWAGVADRRTGQPFEHDTAAVIFSCTKGILAICAYLLVQEGRLDLDRPIASYWPAFAGAGKEHITVREAMSHRAGLAYLDRDLTREEVLAWSPVIEAIEAQEPHHAPSDGHAYHAMTYGWIVGEVIRRVTGLSPGTWFREVLGDPLDLDTWIGLPPSARGRVAFMEPPLPDAESDIASDIASLGSAPHIERTLTMGGAYSFPADEGYVTFNAPDIQAAEVPGAGGISSAESLAKLYAMCITGVDGAPALLTPGSIADALLVRSAGAQLTGLPDDGARWGTGFQLSSPPTQPMLGPGSLGHAGAGGQLAFADADSGASFAYLSNQMGGYGDHRARALTEALRGVLDR